MELPPSAGLVATFTKTSDVLVCSRSACQRTYNSCTDLEQKEWRLFTDDRNTGSNGARFVCGPCTRYYESKPTTTIKGAKRLKLTIELITYFFCLADTVRANDANMFDINQQVAAVQRGRSKFYTSNSVPQ
jgi:hypothetical protein